MVLGSRTLLALLMDAAEASEEGKRARLAAFCLTSAGLDIFGTGLALNAPLSFSFFSSSSFCLASLASFCAFIFAAKASDESWKVAFVTGFVLFCVTGGTYVDFDAAAPFSSCRFWRSSFSCLSFAAMASPGSWKVALVGALVDF